MKVCTPILSFFPSFLFSFLPPFLSSSLPCNLIFFLCLASYLLPPLLYILVLSPLLLTSVSQSSFLCHPSTFLTFLQFAVFLFLLFSSLILFSPQDCMYATTTSKLNFNFFFQEFGYIHLSAGDLLREERASGSQNGDLIESCIKEGKIVPVEITISLIEKVKHGNTMIIIMQLLIQWFYYGPNTTQIDWL